MLEVIGTALIYGGLGLMAGSIALRLTWARPRYPASTLPDAVAADRRLAASRPLVTGRQPGQSRNSPLSGARFR